jgi:hypothetical protein
MEFFFIILTGSGAPCIGTPGGFLEDSDRGVMLTIYLCLVLRSTMVELYLYTSTPPYVLMQLYRPLYEKCT